MEAEVVCKACNSLGKLGNGFPLFFSHYVGSRNLLVKRSWKSHGGRVGLRETRRQNIPWAITKPQPRTLIADCELANITIRATQPHLLLWSLILVHGLLSYAPHTFISTYFHQDGFESANRRQCCTVGIVVRCSWHASTFIACALTEIRSLLLFASLRYNYKIWSAGGAKTALARLNLIFNSFFILHRF